jgi:hypothetical protein
MEKTTTYKPVQPMAVEMPTPMQMPPMPPMAAPAPMPPQPPTPVYQAPIQAAPAPAPQPLHIHLEYIHYHQQMMMAHLHHCYQVYKCCPICGHRPIC